MKVSRSRRSAIPSLAAALAIVAGGCQALPPASAGAAPSAIRVEPSGPPVLGIDWGRAASIERPANYVETVSPSFQGVHPILRIPGQATMSDVLALPTGGYVSVGYSPPEWTPLAWTSPDGSSWTIHDLGESAFTFPEALAAGPENTIVAVGRSGHMAMAWRTTDGVTWEERPVSIIGSRGEPERMAAIAAGSDGLVAGGSVGPELAERHARFWTSPDGAEWQPVPDDAAAFADAEVRGVTSFGDGYVAIGVVGNVQAQSGGVVWTSPDGISWTRIDDPAFDGDLPQAVIEAPFGGLVAVGSNDERREAVAWTSADGSTWTRAPTENSRLYPGYAEGAGGYIQMVDATPIGDEVVAIGGFQGLQRGTATSWVTTDGLRWEQAVRAPVQQQAEFYAIAAGGPGAIVVGSFGAPDSYVPQVWLSPAR